MTLAQGLYTDAEDRNIAVQIASSIVASGRRAGSVGTPQEILNAQPSSHSGASVEFFSEGRISHNVAMRLKNMEQKFSGDLGECWQKYVDAYNQIARDYKLNPSQNLQYLHNTLSKDAQRFYIDRVEQYATTYQQAIDMIDREYNSPVRQTRIKNYLKSLRVRNFVLEGMEVSTALAKV